MKMIDKAVSTEDLYLNISNNNNTTTTFTNTEAIKLNMIFNILVDNKVDILKKNNKRKRSSTFSDPKCLIHKIKGITSHNNDKKEKLSLSVYKNNHIKKIHDHPDDNLSIMNKKIKIQHSNECDIAICNSNSSSISNISSNYKRKHTTDNLISMAATNSEYASIKIEDHPNSNIINNYSNTIQTRRKHRKRRKRKRNIKKHLKQQQQQQLNVDSVSIPINNEHYKIIDPDELSQRARFTIAVTACLLLVMCLLLVGITLRMAPIIDDMVRKENEELMNSFNRDTSMLHNSSVAVPPNIF